MHDDETVGTGAAGPDRFGITAVAPAGRNAAAATGVGEALRRPMQNAGDRAAGLDEPDRDPRTRRFWR
jgi:hypothetical protein